QGAEAVAARLDEVHLGDLLVERAAGEGHAKDALLEAAVFFVETAAAAVLPLVVAPDAAIRLVQRTGEIAAGIGQCEAVAGPPISVSSSSPSLWPLSAPASASLISLTARRCTKRRLTEKSGASLSCRACNARTSPAIPNNSPRKSSTCGARSTRSSLSALRSSA